ncbi:MAG: HDOD domain-containing protein [Gammaproteobacteria bacterium]
MEPQIKPGQLRFFSPFRNLSAESIIPLASRVHVRAARRGERLALGERMPQEYFLLEGELDLRARDGRSLLLVAGSDVARAAVAAEQARPCTVTARTDARLIEVDRELLDALAADADTDAAVDASAVGAEHRGLYLIFHADLRADRIRLPSLPQVAMKVRTALEAEDTGIADIGRIIGSDPVFAAKIVRVANSVLFRGSREARSCAEAVARLGLHTTRELVVCFAVRDVFKAPTAALRAQVGRAWAAAVEVGVLCQVLARSLRRLNPERALLAGLLHNVGMIAVVPFTSRRMPVDATPGEIDAANRALAPAVGADILRHWHLGEDLALAAARAGDWTYDSGAALDYLDLVVAALLHVRLQRATAQDLPVIDHIPALRKLAQAGMTAAACRQALIGAEPEIAGTRQLFL